MSFRRQHPAGSYVLDFYCAAIGLAIELDCGQHGFAGAIAHDKRRTSWLESHDVKVLRFWNNDVLDNTDGVLQVIAAEIDQLQSRQKTPTRRWRADLPLSGEGNGACTHEKA